MMSLTIASRNCSYYPLRESCTTDSVRSEANCLRPAAGAKRLERGGPQKTKAPSRLLRDGAFDVPKRGAASGAC